MGTPSPPDSLDSIRDRLGDLQALAATICQQTESRMVSRVFSQVSNIIWMYYDDSPPAVETTCSKCYSYLQGIDRDELLCASPECEEKINTAYEETRVLYEFVHS